MTEAKDAPHQELTYKVIGLAMEVHNELGPGHREADYQKALAIKLRVNDLEFEDEPRIKIRLASGERVGMRRPDFVVARCVLVEIKARGHLMTKDDLVQVIGYFAILPECRVGLFINFGRPHWNTIVSFLRKKSLRFSATSRADHPNKNTLLDRARCLIVHPFSIRCLIYRG